MLLGYKIAANGEGCERQGVSVTRVLVRKGGLVVPLLVVTVGAGPSAAVDAVRAVGWYGVDVYHRLACSGGCYDVFSSVSPIDAVDACCDTCGLRPVVELSVYAQPGMVARDVSVCVEEGDVLVFESDPRVSPVLFAVSRPMWGGFLGSPRGWREFVVAAGACGLLAR